MGIDAIVLHRLSRRLHALGVPVLPGVLRRTSFYLHNSYIPTEVEIGEGTVLGYAGMGIVVHRDAKIGRYCLIAQQVTLGGRSGQPGAPVIGDFVRIGAGARILGNVKVGDFATIGANAVVLTDVAPGAVVVGIPAREVRIEPDPVAAWERETGRTFPANEPRPSSPTLH